MAAVSVVRVEKITPVKLEAVEAWTS